MSQKAVSDSSSCCLKGLLHSCDGRHSISLIQRAHNMERPGHHWHLLHEGHHNYQPSFHSIYQIGSCQVKVELYNKLIQIFLWKQFRFKILFKKMCVKTFFFLDNTITKIKYSSNNRTFIPLPDIFLYCFDSIKIYKKVSRYVLPYKVWKTRTPFRYWRWTALGFTNSLEIRDGWWQHHSSEKGHMKRY